MQVNRAYIISWLGQKHLVAERLERIQEVLAWCKKKALVPYIIAMEWKESYYTHFQGVQWIKLPVKLPPAHARNVALNILYSTEEDYGILLDDDSYIERGDDIIDTLRGLSTADARQLGVLTVQDSAECYNDKSNEPEHILYSSGHATSGIFIVLNVAKYTTSELFFNTRFNYHNGVLQFGEDVNFMRRAWRKALPAYEVKSSTTNSSRETSHTTSTWLPNNSFTKFDGVADYFKRLDQLNTEDGVGLDKNIPSPVRIKLRKQK